MKTGKMILASLAVGLVLTIATTTLIVKDTTDKNDFEIGSTVTATSRGFPFSFKTTRSVAVVPADLQDEAGVFVTNHNPVSPLVGNFMLYSLLAYACLYVFSRKSSKTKR